MVLLKAEGDGWQSLLVVVRTVQERRGDGLVVCRRHLLHIPRDTSAQIGTTVS